MTGHHSVPPGKRVIVWWHSGRVVVDRFVKEDRGIITLAKTGDVSARRLRHMTLYRGDRPLPVGTEKLA